MNRLLHTIVLIRDRTMAFTWRGAWRWSGIDTSEVITFAVGATIILLAYGVARD